MGYIKIEAFVDRILSSATIDRVCHAYKVVLEGKSSRSPRPATKLQPEPSKKGIGIPIFGTAEGTHVDAVIP